MVEERKTRRLMKEGGRSLACLKEALSMQHGQKRSIRPAKVKKKRNKSFGAGGGDSVTTFCGLAVSNSYTPLTADLSLSLLVILY